MTERPYRSSITLYASRQEDSFLYRDDPDKPKLVSNATITTHWLDDLLAQKNKTTDEIQEVFWQELAEVTSRVFCRLLGEEKKHLWPFKGRWAYEDGHNCLRQLLLTVSPHVEVGENPRFKEDVLEVDGGWWVLNTDPDWHPFGYYEDVLPDWVEEQTGIYLSNGGNK